eukprot:GILK01008333.1.p1 GENE.GILK01008333.1~~GILK01008333.1.p1  ORF type:complete len:585 (-),score=127.95 GILK01008333.1:154-1821(-)
MADREVWLSRLSVKINVGTHGPHQHQVLHLELTDEADPFFLYTMEIGEAEYHELKTEQSLLVDFQTFPSRIIELLEHTISGNGDENAKFICSLKSSPQTNEAKLFIVETNNFKHLVHLTLRFRAGNDDALKKFLAEKLKQFKASALDYSERLQRTETDLSSQAVETERLRSELRRLNEDHERGLAQAQLERSQALSGKQEEYLAKQAASQRTFDEEKQRLEKRMDSVVRELQTRIDNLEASNKQLTETKFQLESTERELRSRISIQANEVQASNAELNQLRIDFRSTQSKLFEKESSLSECTTRIAALEQQVINKDELLKHNATLLDTAKAQKINLEESLELYKKNLAKAEEKITVSVQEINKANQIIPQLQAELKSVRSKVKVKSTVVKQQEQVINEKQSTIDLQSRDITDLKRTIETKEAEIISTNGLIQTLKSKLEESQNLIQSNSQTISWLNSQLNKAQSECQKASAATSFRPSSAFSFKPSTDMGFPSPGSMPPMSNMSAPMPLDLPTTVTGVAASSYVSSGLSSLPFRKTGTVTYTPPPKNYSTTTTTA